MTPPPLLTDRIALTRHRARASADILHREVQAEFEERRAVVNKSFTEIAAVSGLRQFWAGPGRVVADDDVLDLVPESLDLVQSVLTLHWANDPVGHLIQCRRALRPDGLFLGATFGGETLAELRTALAEAEIAVTGGLSPRVVPMGDIRDYGALLQRAGFAMPVADSQSVRLAYRDGWHALRDLRAMGEANALSGRLRRPTRRTVLDQAIRRLETMARDTDGRVVLTFEIIFLTGWAPGPEQPTALRPGSATARLADALGTAETRLPEKAGPTGG